MPPKRLVSGGNDKIVKLWEFRAGEVNPIEQTIGHHDDLIRDVAWSSNVGNQFDMIASCSEDKTCKVWKQDFHSKENPWSCFQISFSENQPLWKVSWSQTGKILAISGGESLVKVTEEDATGDWKEV